MSRFLAILAALIATAAPSFAQAVLRGPLTTNSPVIKGALDGGLLDAATNNFFRVPVGVNTNLVVTNIALGQVIRVDLFVTNGFTATFVQETANNTTAGFAVTVSSNTWQTVYIARPDTAVTNFDFRSALTSGTGNFTTNANGAATFIPATGMATNHVQVLSTNLQVVAGVNSNSTSFARALTGSTSDIVQWQTTNAAAISGIHSNHGAYFSNVSTKPFGVERPLPFVLWNWTNAVTITNTVAATSAITNGVDNVMTLPAGFWTLGKTVKFTAEGYMNSSSATPTTFAVQWDTTMLASNIVALPTTLGGDYWFVEFTVRCATNSATGALYGSGKIAWQASAGPVTSVLPRRMQNGLVAAPAIVNTTGAGTLDFIITPGATTHSFTLINANAYVSP